MTIGNWERGKEQPGIRHVAAILGFLGYDPEPVSDSLPDRLWAIRRRLGLTQAELARRLGQDEKQICRWEGGRQLPHSWIANRIDLGLRTLEGRPPDGPEPQLSYFDLTRWRRRRTIGLGDAKPRTLGEQLREARLRLGLNQDAAGRLLGISRGTLHRIERGWQQPGGSLARRIRKAFSTRRLQAR